MYVIVSLSNPLAIPYPKNKKWKESEEKQIASFQPETKEKGGKGHFDSKEGTKHKPCHQILTTTFYP